MFAAFDGIWLWPDPFGMCAGHAVGMPPATVPPGESQLMLTRVPEVDTDGHLYVYYAWGLPSYIVRCLRH